MAVGYRALYQVILGAKDVKSGKLLTNLLYYRSGTGTGSPPAFDSPIAGASLGAFLTALGTLFTAQILPLLSVNYTQTLLTVRKIVGWKYNGPELPIVGSTPLLTGTSFSIGGALPQTTPFFGSIAGAIGFIPGVWPGNGIWTISPTGTNTFTTTANTAANPWAAGGTLQKVGTSEGWKFTDIATLAASGVGGITGEALPLFSDVSFRRIGSTVGRRFQGRNSYAPIGEASQLNGKLTSTALTAWTAAAAAFLVATSNGGTEGDSRDNMFPYNVSLKRALSLATPFDQPNVDAFTSVVASGIIQPNMGSFVKRKPRLTAVIA